MLAHGCAIHCMGSLGRDLRGAERLDFRPGVGEIEPNRRNLFEILGNRRKK